MRQSDEARDLFNQRCVTIGTALMQFSDWLKDLAPKDEIHMWGNGSDFDNVILTSAYRSTGIPLPWNFWSNRCYRSMKSLHPEIEMMRTGTHHNALDDAESQAMHLMAILNAPEPVRMARAA
jgi:exodeoxyribonuclease VIII